MESVKSLWVKETCGMKHRYGNLTTEKGKSFANGLALRELFYSKGIDFTVADVEGYIKIFVPDSLFQTERERHMNNQLLAQRLLRLKTELDKMSGTFLHGCTEELCLYGNSFESSYHFMRVNDKAKTVDVCYVKNKKKDLKSHSKVKNLQIDKSMELYILQKIGEKLYPDYYVNGVIFYLSGAMDKTGYVHPSFNKASQSVVMHFCGSGATEMEDRLMKVIGLSDDHFPCEGKCEECYYKNLCTYTEKAIIPLSSTTVSKAPSTVKFTKAQEEFMGIEDGVYRVLAGAGSGKTTCIANRMVELLDKGNFPEEILLITYTTKGVEELKEKIDYWLHVNFMDEEYPLDRFQIYTFNGFGYELIKQEYTRFGFTDVPKVLDKYEKFRIIKNLLDESDEIEGLNYVNPFSNFFGGKGAVLQVEEWFNTIKKEGLTYPEELEESARIKLSIAKQVMDLYLEYDKFYKENNFVDFDDQIEMMSSLFDDAMMVDTYGFKHIMVDEYQESDNLQTEILQKLLTYKGFRSFVVVGDDSQAIYSWRGASSENIINFDTIFNDVKDIKMMDNFRSTKQIIGLANNINDINKRKVPKDLIASKTGERVELLNGTDILDLAQQIKEDIKAKKLRYSDIALISRNKKELLMAQNYFILHGIPSVLATSEALVDNQKIAMLTDFASFLVDAKNELGLAEFYKLTDYKEFVKAEKKGDLTSYLNTKMLDLFKVMRTKKGAYHFFLTQLKELGKEDKAIAKLDELIAEKQLKSINEIAEFLLNMRAFQADYFVEKTEDRVDAITLTTAHSSKGREWPVVYVYLDKFKYPKHYNIFAPEKNDFLVEEERRLLFVAITRAKERLTLLGDKNSEIYGEVAVCKRRH